MNFKCKLMLLLSLMTIVAKQAAAQVCNGSLGDPVVLIDFGSGENTFGPPLGNKTTYRYISSGGAFEGPSDGEYTIIKNIRSGGWHYTENHSPNDPNGYFMLINASFDPGTFYETDVPTDLCPNTTYEFACWVTNLLKSQGIRPNLTFQVLTMDNQILHTLSTGDIPETSEATWKQYGSLFSTPVGVSRIKIKIINNAPGGSGNDLAIDDITFRPCGTKITTSIDNVANQTTKTICEGEMETFNISSSVEGTATLRYLWQKRSGTDWSDLSAETNPQINIDPSVLPPGIHEYRVVVAEPGNFDSPACRTGSSPVSLTVKPNPKINLAPMHNVCIGQNIRLDLSGTAGTYEWTGPNSFRSSSQSPTISNAGPNDNGVYTVIVSTNGCTSTAQTTLAVYPVPIARVANANPSICYGEGVELLASGGTSFSWNPTTGLSDPNIRNPVASPTSTTTYEVTVSNPGCEDKTSVTVNVYKQTLANAGNNKVIMEGDTTTLHGSVSGDNLYYFWTPSDHLDDPNKLSPIASPLVTTTYTLNVSSQNNCANASSSVIVKVFKKVIVPNTFTPNGDGINDLWNIDALQAYPNAEIKVMNRFGERVFSAKGNFQNWNGQYKGKALPVGTYYYWIELHELGQKPLVGPLTILR